MHNALPVTPMICMVKYYVYILKQMAATLYLMVTFLQKARLVQDQRSTPWVAAILTAWLLTRQHQQYIGEKWGQMQGKIPKWIPVVMMSLTRQKNQATMDGLIL